MMEAAGHVLLVEDVASLRITLERALRLHRYDVTAVALAEQAKAVFAADRIDFLLTDVSLPGDIDGFALADWARSFQPRLPIVLISGLALDRPPARLMVDLYVRMLPKPFTMETLMSALTSLRLPGVA